MTKLEEIARSILRSRYYEPEPEMYGCDVGRFDVEVAAAYPEHVDEARRDARAAVEAMRDPSDGSVHEGAASLDHPSVFMGGPSQGNRRNACRAWYAMIDAILSEPPPPASSGRTEG